METKEKKMKEAKKTRRIKFVQFEDVENNVQYACICGKFGTSDKNIKNKKNS